MQSMGKFIEKMQKMRDSEKGRIAGQIEGKIEAYIDCNMTIPEIAKKVSKPEEYVREVVKKLSAVSQ